jgi:hypothetical protein
MVLLLLRHHIPHLLLADQILIELVLDLVDLHRRVLMVNHLILIRG